MAGEAHDDFRSHTELERYGNAGFASNVDWQVAFETSARQPMLSAADIASRDHHRSCFVTLPPPIAP